jgi:hypothetical protein
VPYSEVMKVWGILFVVIGAFWTIAGFISYKSDIQLGIGLAGINMFGIGLIMIHLANKKDGDHNSGDSEVSTE